MELMPKEWQRQKDPGQSSRRCKDRRETEAGSMRLGARSQGTGCGSVAVQGVGGEGARLEGLPSSVCQWGVPEAGEAGERGREG